MHSSFRSHSPSVVNQYPPWLAIAVAVVALVCAAGIAGTFPTYGSGQSSFDSDGMKNFGSTIKAGLTWTVGIAVASASVFAGLVEGLRARGETARQATIAATVEEQAALASKPVEPTTSV